MSQNNLYKTIKEQVSTVLLEEDEAATITKISINRSSKKVKIKLNSDKPFSVYFKKISDIVNDRLVWNNLLKKAVKKQLRKKSHKTYYVASMTDGFKLTDIQGLELIEVIAILSELDSVFFYATTEQFSAFNRKNNNKIVCEKNNFYTVDPREDPNQVNVTPNFTSNLSQFLERIGASTALTRQTGFNYSEYAKDIYVFVLDTGISRHAELNIDETLSRDFTNSETGWIDIHGHGTHVAGSIAAKDGNIGVAPGVKVIAHKILGDNGRGLLDFQMRSLEEIARVKNENPNAKIIVNMSLGGIVRRNEIGSPFSSTRIYNNTEILISKLSNKNNITFVAAAGNSTHDASVIRPARVIEAITVGAYDSTNNTIANFSNFGPLVDIIAPGVNINSTLPPFPFQNSLNNTRTGVLSGTSMAAPLVAGVIVNMIALEAMRNPNKTLTPAEIRQRLRNDAEGSFNNIKNPQISMDNPFKSFCWNRNNSPFSQIDCSYWFNPQQNGQPSALNQTYPYSVFIGSYTKDGATIQNY